MNKNEFLSALRKELRALPPQELERQLCYYNELWEDMADDGMTEAEISAKLGSVTELAEAILREQPLGTLLRSAAKPKKGWNALSIVLAIVGSPIWLSLLLVLIAVVIVVFVSLWAVVLSVAAVGVAAVVGGFVVLGSLFFTLAGIGNILFYSGVGLAAIGVGIGLFLGGLWLIKQLVRLIGRCVVVLKNSIIRKDKNNHENMD